MNTKELTAEGDVVVKKESQAKKILTKLKLSLQKACQL